MEDKCTRQTAARDEAREKGRRCVMRSREKEEAGPPFPAGASCLLGSATLPLNCPQTKCLPCKHVYSPLPLPSFYLVCAGGTSQAVLPDVEPVGSPPPTDLGGYMCSRGWGTTGRRLNLTWQKHCFCLEGCGEVELEWVVTFSHISSACRCSCMHTAIGTSKVAILSNLIF